MYSDVCIFPSSFSKIIEDCLRLQFRFTKEFYAKENAVFILSVQTVVIRKWSYMPILENPLIQ